MYELPDFDRNSVKTFGVLRGVETFYLNTRNYPRTKVVKFFAQMLTIPNRIGIHLRLTAIVAYSSEFYGRIIVFDFAYILHGLLR